MTFYATLKWFMYLALAAIVIRVSVLLVYRLENKFMEPTLKTESILLGSKWAYGIRFPWSESGYFTGSPKAGDIVSLEFKNQPGIIFVKRIVAGPGDRIKIENSQLILNNKKCEYTQAESNDEKDVGQVLIEDCGAHKAPIYTFSNDMNYQEHLLAKGEYFTLYDNREFEGDLAQFSIVKFDQILGKVYFNF